MPEQSHPPEDTAASAAPPYGWVIVAACALMIFVTYGLIYSYSVFFKPLAENFHWDRATVSLIYSLSVIIRGAAAIGAGWLADKYGPRKVLLVCGVLMGAGYLLSSQVTTLGQFFLTYAVVEAFGMSGAFGVGTALVSQWFTKNRGLALGIVGSGSGLGTFLIVPAAERLVSAAQWSTAFIVIGIAAGVLMIIAALFLRNPPVVAPAAGKSAGQSSGASFGEAIRDSRLYLIMAAFLFFFFGTQIVMVHLVNYATDVGINPLAAATFVGVIGVASIVSRLSIGVIAEKIGIYRSLMLMSLFLAVAFVLLLFTRAPWSFYVFAVLFSIPYGGEVTQIPLVISKYFGTRVMATLMGVTVFVIGIGGAFGPWLAGWIFDITDNYNAAFIVGAVAGTASMFAVFLLKRQDSRNGHPAVK
jgi:MFS family permease